MRVGLLLLGCFVFVLSGAAFAQPSSQTAPASQPTTTPASGPLSLPASGLGAFPASEPASGPGGKSPWKASLLSVAPTATGITLGVLGIARGTLHASFERTPLDRVMIGGGGALIGTSLVLASPLGHVYSTDRKHLKQIAIIDGISLGAMGLLLATYPEPCGEDGVGVLGLCPREGEWIVMIGSSALVVTGVAFWNMIDSAFTVQRLEGDPVVRRWLARWRAAAQDPSASALLAF